MFTHVPDDPILPQLTANIQGKYREIVTILGPTIGFWTEDWAQISSLDTRPLDRPQPSSAMNSAFADGFESGTTRDAGNRETDERDRRCCA